MYPFTRPPYNVDFSAAGGGFNFDVANPCSGIRSLLALTALTAAYAWFSQDKQWKKWTLFLAAVPLAIAGNVFRILTIAIVAHFLGQEAAMGLYHDYSGFIVFSAAVLLMVAFGHLLSRFPPDQNVSPTPVNHE